MFIFSIISIFYLNHNMKGLVLIIMLCILWLMLAIIIFRFCVLIIELFDYDYINRDLN